MNHRIAFYLGVVIIASIAYDVAFQDSKTLVFLGRWLLDAIYWVQFWR